MLRSTKNDFFFLIQNTSFGIAEIDMIESIMQKNNHDENNQVIWMQNNFDIIKSNEQGLTFFTVSVIVVNRYSKWNFINWRKT